MNANYSTIRIKNKIREELDSLKVENESYSVVISNLLEKNKILEEHIEYLKEDKAKLYELALNTDNSEALILNRYKIIYLISIVANDNTLTEEEKLHKLKEHLTGILGSNNYDVFDNIKYIIKMLELEEETVPDFLYVFEEYVEEHY